MKVMVPVAPEKALITNSVSDVNPADWSPSAAYACGATVTYAHNVYLALVDNTAKYPDREPEVWRLLHPATPAAWASSKTYASGDMVTFQRQRYTSTREANTGYVPETAKEWWSCSGPVNSWAAFDKTLNTKATALDAITYELDFSGCNGIALFGVEGASVDFALRNSTGDVVLEKTIALAGVDAASWFDYFYGGITPREDVVKTDFPLMVYNRLTITVKAPEGVARVGHLAVGRCKTIGLTQLSAETGISDFSRKTTDTFGNTYLAEGKWAKNMRLGIVLENARYDDVFRTLASLRAKPTVFVGDNADKGFESLTVWGFVRDFRMVIDGVTHSQCSLEVQGLV